MQITEPHKSEYALFSLGFRPFFLLGSLFAAVTILPWMLITEYQQILLPDPRLSPMHWHAHEMLFGYAMAVISGFLLTAVTNWTGIQTLHGLPLLLLTVLWALARSMPYLPFDDALLLMVILDLLFNLLVCVLVWRPIAKAGQLRQQAGVGLLLGLLFIANVLFYLGLLQLLDNGIRMGLYTGLYAIISLIMLMGYRVMPFFIKKGIGYPVELRDYAWINYASVVLMLVFVVFDVYFPQPEVTVVCAILLAGIHALRLFGWHSVGIWKKPLLWILYVGYGWIVVGFVLIAAAYFFNTDIMLAVHAFAYGAIGMVTIGMMARVSLGHSGRNVFNPPPFLLPVFVLLLAGGIVRVLLPLVMIQNGSVLILVSQILWMLAFMLFTVRFFSVLVKPSL